MIDSVLNILIVDDEAITIQTVADILDKKHNILVATNGKSALDIIDKIKPHIIILDIVMPDMDGFELTKKIYEDKKNKDINIIFLSANNSIEYMEKGFKLGASDYITKPINPKNLLLKINFWSKFVQKSIENQQNIKLLEQYKDVVDRSSIISKTNKHGIITYVNNKFCKISGYSSEELIGKSHNIVRHKDMSSSIFKEVWKIIKTGKSWHGIIKNRKKDGSSYIVDTVINPIIDSNGDIFEYIAVRYDITEVEEYKELLKNELHTTSKTLDEYKNYLSQYEDAINSITAVMKTDTNNKITYANKKFCEIMKYESNELIGKHCSKIRVEKKCNSSKIKKQLEKKEIVIDLLENKTKNGNSIFCTTLFYPIFDINGKIIEHLQVMHDITDIIKLNEEIDLTQKEVVFTMGAIGESRSKETGLHVKRVAEYSYLLAKLSGMSEKKANLLKQASPMHDIGKVGIPDNILNKAGKLTNDEFEVIKTHSTLGYEMLKYSNRDILKTAATIAYTHHEKWDGNGYPNKLEGKNIPIEGRITAIADVFDALGHDRCYKKAWKLEDILKLFKKEKGKHFDPELIEIFFKNLDQFLEIQEKLSDEF